ncbi:MAG: TOMM precursor leader peptide-binding protein [Sneathiellaceae bacterium]
MDLAVDRSIGLNPHFSVHVLDEGQLLLLSEQRSFRLSGRLYVALVPYLDGRRTIAEILAAFAGHETEERLRLALGNLLAKGYAGYLDPAAPATRQALWAELGLAPAEAERNLAAVTVAVRAMPGQQAPGAAAAGQAARRLRRALVEAGLRLVAQRDADLTIVSVSDCLHRDLAALDRRMRRAGRSWMLLKAGGAQPLIGPLFRPAGGPCWACLADRMLENRPGDNLVPDEVRAVRAATGHSGASLGLAVHVAAMALARAAAEGGLGRFAGRIHSLDPAGGGLRAHDVPADPHCPVCGVPHDPAGALHRASAPLVLQARPVLRQVDGGWRVATAGDVVRRLQPHVSPITGMLADLEDISPDPGLPVFGARQANMVRPSLQMNRLVGRPGAAVGKGMTPEQARASCLAEAIERHLANFTPHAPRRRATRAELGPVAPHPDSYLMFSERQFDRREEWNRTHYGFNWTGERFDEGRAIEWSPAWSLTHGALRWLPTRFCYYNYEDASLAPGTAENAFCSADSNGCAAGSSIEEAVLQGFLELVERDACALWWYNRLRRPAFDLSHSADPFLRRVRDFCDAGGRGLHVLDLTNDLGIPVAIALSHRLADGGGITLGLGAHLDAGIAINRALAELNQMMTLEPAVSAPQAADSPNADEAVMHDWLANHSIASEPYCRPDGSVDPAIYPAPPVADLREAIGSCTRILADRGLDLIVHDLRRPDIDFAAARAVVPGLRHFWARFGGRRLYDAPVALGWLDRPRTEEELNPIPFFF